MSKFIFLYYSFCATCTILACKKTEATDLTSKSAVRVAHQIKEEAHDRLRARACTSFYFSLLIRADYANAAVMIDIK